MSVTSGSWGSTPSAAAGNSPAGYAALLSQFFERLETLEPVMRIILRHAPLSAELTFRGEDERTVVLDFKRQPGRITVGAPSEPCTIRLKVDSDIMHQVLLGQLHPGVAMGRRAMLLRGAASDLARFIPLFDFAPLLYREHARAQGADTHARAAGAPLVKEVDMNATDSDHHVPSLSVKSRSEQVLLRMVEQLAFGAGYGMGVLRHRFLRNLSLFDVLGALARGVAAAEPPQAGESGGSSDHVGR